MMATAVFATLGALANAGPTAEGSKPHILFILQDDLGHYDVGFNGNTESGATVTYNITQLARDGIVLASHYTHWHCSPTRRSFLSGRLPIHHHEQLSGDATDDLDLRWTWVSEKLKSAGYNCYWYGKGHTGYKSMKHLPINKGFDHFTGFLGGSQSYTSNERWEDDHPMRTDAEMVNAPARCTFPSIGKYSKSANLWDSSICPKSISVFPDAKFMGCSGTSSSIAASNLSECCTACVAPNCSHWTFANNTCAMWSGRCERFDEKGSTSGVTFHPGKGPSPPAPPPQPKHNDTKCHADSYSTTLYGEFALQALDGHDASTPFFLYFPIQAVHTPYDAVPFFPGLTYAGMLWDSDIYIGAIVNLLKSKEMYDNTLIVYTADNGGTIGGLNYPLRGEKHTNWDGGMRTAAFVSGGIIPASLRGTKSNLNCHVVDWYPTFSYLAGVDGTDDPPVPPAKIDPSDPTKDIWGNHSYPSVDGVNIWSMLTNPSDYNRSSAHPYLVLSKEVVLAGNYKLLVAQNYGWDHSADDGWKIPGPNGSWGGAQWIKPNKTYPCGVNDLPGALMTLPGVPGQLPCLFDLEADTGEHEDLGSDPANHELLNHLWDVLNQTVMTRYCRDIKSHSSGSCDRTPVEMLGNCDQECSSKHWATVGGAGTSGPICGVPGC